ncbi:MAG: DoxX family protein [Xanthobacteraceae bacterium]
MSLIQLLETGRSLAERIPYSLVALVARFGVASVFWRSGQTKVEGFHIREATFFLFRDEYKVPLLPPDLAAYISTIAEHVFPVLLVIGLASRLSALALFGMTMVIQLFVFPDGWPEHILWIGLMLIIIARGPGALSLDHLFWTRLRPDHARIGPAATKAP